MSGKIRDAVTGRERAVLSGPAADGKDQHSPSDAADDAEVARLAGLSPMVYDREREASAQRLGCRVGTLDEIVRAARCDRANAPAQGRPINLPEPKLWPEAVDGSALLHALSSTIREYVILSDVQADAVALWSVLTHAHNATDVSPKLVLRSAQKRSGKTRLAQAMERLVARPLLVSGIRPAALLRIIETHAPTLLLDEMDAAMKQDREMAETLRGIINSGFDRAGARFIMNVPTPGGGYEPRQFSTWAPQLLSGIGDLPDTVRDRSIEIEMVRKRRDETVKRLRRRDGEELNVLGQKSARWASDNLESLRSATPEMPPSLSDRAADAWEPLFAIADVAGGDWPRRARNAAIALSGEHVKGDDNVVTMLFADIAAIFGGHDHVTSERLVAALAEIEGRPWAEFGRAGKSITKHQLARLLRPYNITPGTIRIGPGPKDTAKGYKLAQFADVLARYLDNPPIPTVTPSQPNVYAGFYPNAPVTPPLDVTDENVQKANVSAGCDGVTVGEGPNGNELDADLPAGQEMIL
jgi:putative DNA primase/helicase